jgi:DNA repair protein RadC
LIIAHNHPGRSLEPSLQDRQLTKTLKAALATVDVGLLDHIIIAGNDYFSFKAHGLSCLA